MFFNMCKRVYSNMCKRVYHKVEETKELVYLHTNDIVKILYDSSVFDGVVRVSVKKSKCGYRDDKFNNILIIAFDVNVEYDNDLLSPTDIHEVNCKRCIKELKDEFENRFIDGYATLLKGRIEEDVVLNRVYNRVDVDCVDMHSGENMMTFHVNISIFPFPKDNVELVVVDDFVNYFS